MKTKLLIEFKYEGFGWELWDWTTVPSWAEHQQKRAREEHPGAEHRIRPEEKRKK